MKTKKLTRAQLEARRWQKDMMTSLHFLDSKHSVRGDKLSKRVGKSKNYLVKVLGQLILNDGHKIGSGMDGYFWVKSEADRAIAVKWLKGRAFKTLLRCSIVANKHVEEMFQEAWKEYLESRTSIHAIERNLGLHHMPKRAAGGER